VLGLATVRAEGKALVLLLGSEELSLAMIDQRPTLLIRLLSQASPENAPHPEIGVDAYNQHYQHAGNQARQGYYRERYATDGGDPQPYGYTLPRVESAEEEG